jgi:hypothetical protein
VTPASLNDLITLRWPAVTIIRSKLPGYPRGVLGRDGDRLGIILDPDLTESEEVDTLSYFIGELERLYPVAS